MTHRIDLDLTWRQMQQLGPLAVTVRLYHKPEGHACSARFVGGQLCANGVNFEDDQSLFCRVPRKVNLVDSGSVMVYVLQATRLGDLCVETSEVNWVFSCQIPKQQDHFPRQSQHTARPFSHDAYCATWRTATPAASIWGGGMREYINGGSR